LLNNFCNGGFVLYAVADYLVMALQCICCVAICIQACYFI